MRIVIKFGGSKKRKTLTISQNATFDDILKQCKGIADKGHQFSVIYKGQNIGKFRSDRIKAHKIPENAVFELLYFGDYVKDEDEEDEEKEENQPKVDDENADTNWIRSDATYQFKRKTGTGIYDEIEYQELHLPAVKTFEWNPTFLDKVKEKKKVIERKRESQSIMDDNKELGDMVLSAKGGQWSNVFSILDRKPYLINGIPQQRAWSALHQAVYLNDVTSVEQLLSYEMCDVNVRAKQDRAAQAKPGDTPLDIAEKHGRKEIKEALQGSYSSAYQENPPSFVPGDLGEVYIKEGVPYFLLSFAFLSKPMIEKLKIHKTSSAAELMHKTYRFLQENWVYARDAIAECLYPFSQDLHQSLKQTSDCTSFFTEMIKTYTKCAVYRQVNTALRRASERLCPTGDDMLLSLYCLFLQAILQHWEGLTRYEGISYRGMTLTQQQFECYKEGVKFVWLSFTSSSSSEHTAQSFGGYEVLFVINNKGVSLSNPLEVKQYSQFQGEDEMLFPAATEFKVEKIVVEKGIKKVYIELIGMQA